MFKIDGADVKGLQRFENMLMVAGEKGPVIITRALNRTGAMARTQVVRSISKETSLPQKMVRNIVRKVPAKESDMVYTLYGAGGDISLKYFKPRETRRGVTAMVRGHRQLFEGNFSKGGDFSRGRVKLNMGGHVYMRLSSERLPIVKVSSGVIIPREMVESATVEIFDRTVEDNLPGRLEHELGRVL